MTQALSVKWLIERPDKSVGAMNKVWGDYNWTSKDWFMGLWPATPRHVLYIRPCVSMADKQHVLICDKTCHVSAEYADSGPYQAIMGTP